MPLADVVRRFVQATDSRLGVALVYHRVGDPPGDPRRELVPALGSALFANQVRYLTRAYRLVRGSELHAAAAARRSGDPIPVAITFDDDLASHADVAAPLLLAVGATATFFVSGTSLDTPRRFWWERLQAVVDEGIDVSTLGLDTRAGIHELGRLIEALSPVERDRLDLALAAVLPPDPPASGLRRAALRQLVRDGFEIGFHTVRHDLLTTLQDGQLESAMEAGRAALADAAGSVLSSISYPHGQADERVAGAARAAGFAAGFTGRRTAVTATGDPLLLGRIAPSYRSVGVLAFEVAATLARAALSDSARARAARQGRA